MILSDRIRAIAIPMTIVFLWGALIAWVLFLGKYQREYQNQSIFAHLRTAMHPPEYDPPARVDFHDEDHVIWIRWSAAEQDSRWSGGKDVGILFRLSGDAAKCVRALRFKTKRTAGPNPATVLINDTPIAHLVLNGAGSYRFDIPPGTLVKGVNDIEFKLPDAHPPGGPDGRILGIGLIDFQLEK